MSIAHRAIISTSPTFGQKSSASVLNHLRNAAHSSGNRRHFTCRASSAARPKDSISLGTSMRSAMESFSFTRSTLPRNSTCLRRPFCPTSHSARERQGPSPISSSREGITFCTRSKISITSQIRLTGRKLETCTRMRSSSCGKFSPVFRGFGIAAYKCHSSQSCKSPQLDS